MGLGEEGREIVSSEGADAGIWVYRFSSWDVIVDAGDGVVNGERGWMVDDHPPPFRADQRAWTRVACMPLGLDSASKSTD